MRRKSGLLSSGCYNSGERGEDESDWKRRGGRQSTIYLRFRVFRYLAIFVRRCMILGSGQQTPCQKNNSERIAGMASFDTLFI